MQLDPFANGREMLNFKHKEAFALMKYVSDADGRVEWFWNSRDGVTPFMVSDPVGAAKGLKGEFNRPHMTHQDWHEDIFCANFVPPVGMRIFVDSEQEKGQPSIATVTPEMQAEFEKLARLQPMRFCGLSNSFKRVPNIPGLEPA